MATRRPDLAFPHKLALAGVPKRTRLLIGLAHACLAANIVLIWLGNNPYVGLVVAGALVVFSNATGTYEARDAGFFTLKRMVVHVLLYALPPVLSLQGFSQTLTIFNLLSLALLLLAFYDISQIAKGQLGFRPFAYLAYKLKRR